MKEIELCIGSDNFSPVMYRCGCSTLWTGATLAKSWETASGKHSWKRRRGTRKERVVKIQEEGMI